MTRGPSEGITRRRRRPLVLVPQLEVADHEESVERGVLREAAHPLEQIRACSRLAAPKVTVAPGDGEQVVQAIGAANVVFPFPRGRRRRTLARGPKYARAIRCSSGCKRLADEVAERREAGEAGLNVK